MTAFFIGDVAVDEYYMADRRPGHAYKGIGGSIANSAVVHAGLGGDTQFISLLNDNPLSQRLIADLRENNVSVDHALVDLTIPAHATSFSSWRASILC